MRNACFVKLMLLRVVLFVMFSLYVLHRRHAFVLRVCVIRLLRVCCLLICVYLCLFICVHPHKCVTVHSNNNSTRAHIDQRFFNAKSHEQICTSLDQLLIQDMQTQKMKNNGLEAYRGSPNKQLFCLNNHHIQTNTQTFERVGMCINARTDCFALLLLSFTLLALPCVVVLGVALVCFGLLCFAVLCCAMLCVALLRLLCLLCFASLRFTSL